MNQLNPLPSRRLNIAVIGTGIAGMSAAWLLNQRHNINVYEKNGRIGGHSNTVEVETVFGPVPVDAGFIVYNERNYPNLRSLFSHLNVPTMRSEMSFAASLEDGGFEYAGTNLDGLLGQRRNVVRPRFWRMMRDLLRFYREAPALLEDGSAGEISLGEFVRRENFAPEFIRDHLLPMGAAIWSTTAEEMEDYPAQAFVRFFVSHGLLKISNRPQWRTVTGGSRQYVKRLTEPYRDRIRFGGIRSVKRRPDGVVVQDVDGRSETYDHVVIAAHADEAYGMLDDPDALEHRLLGSWRYTENRAVLHSDVQLMPKRGRVWSSWNFLGGDRGEPLCVTYWMNRLQNLDPRSPLFVTLNPNREVKPGATYREFTYTHPFFDRQALASQQHLWQLQGRRRTWFCGSYFGYGFHEDALQSGLAVAEQLGGVRRPWQVPGDSDRIQLLPVAEESAA